MRPLQSAGGRRWLVVIAACLAVVVAASVAPAAAGPAPLAPPASVPAPTIPDPLRPPPPLAASLANVAVSSSANQAAVQQRDSIDRSRLDAAQVKAETSSTLEALGHREALLSSQIRQAQAAARRASARISSIRTDVRTLAVANYINGTGTSQDASALLLDSRRHNDLGSRQVLVSAVGSTQLTDLHRYVVARDRARNAAELSTAVREGVRQRVLDTSARRRQAVADEQRFSVDLMTAQAQVEETRRLSTVEGADFPLVVLDAYVEAAALMTKEEPGCHLPWWALAGIGRIESGHGTSGGAEVLPDGSLTRPIVGVPLTGIGNVAAIPDTDAGLLDGDPTVDRAAGPMQFIPSTWERWARDGNGDGQLDIQNVYDAAAAAAAYLCAGGPMDTDARLQQGYFSYNHSLPYVATVLDSAHVYARSVTLG